MRMNTWQGLGGGRVQYIAQNNPRFDLQNIQFWAKYDPRKALNVPAVITAFTLQSAVFLLHIFLLYSPATRGEENMEDSTWGP